MKSRWSSATQLCLPLQLTSKKELEVHSSRHDLRYDLVELWLDLIEDLDKEFCERVIPKLRDSLILLFRRPDLSPSRTNPALRQRTYELAATHGSFVDLDIEVQRDEIETLKSLTHQPKLIASFHDYTKTPRLAQLLSKAEEMKKLEPTIIKFSCFCNTEKDALTLLSLQHSLQQDGQKSAVMGMGRYGCITRVFGPLYGSYLQFLPETEEGASAVGQLTLDEYLNITALLSRALTASEI